jgi:threonine dehydratase
VLERRRVWVSGTGFAASESEIHPRLRGRFIHPFDDDDFISGNGTIGLEILEDVPDVDAVVVPVGGGGLVAGLGAVFRHERPTVRIYTAEPETAAPLSASLAAGRPVHLEHWTRSFVDGAGGKSVLPSMWPLLKAAVDEAIVVPLADAGAAMRRVAERVHVIMEGAAACAVAAALSPAVRARGHRRIVAIVSGGNIDLSQFASIVGACPA